MGSDIIGPRIYEDWESCRADLTALDEAIDDLPEGARKVFLKDMVMSLQVATRLFSGLTPSFEEKVEVLVGAQKGREPESVIHTATSNLDRLLASSGFVTGTLKQRVHAWRRRAPSRWRR